MLVVFLALGLVSAVIDRRLRGSPSIPATLALVAASSTLPMLLRSGVPDGVVVLSLDVVGFAAVGWTVVNGVPSRIRARKASPTGT